VFIPITAMLVAEFARLHGNVFIRQLVCSDACWWRNPTAVRW